MRRPALTTVALIAVAAGALALRLPRLDRRPMHTDEAIHAWKFEELRQGRYRYDPTDFHGPTLYYATFPAFWLSGARTWAATTEATYRIVPVVCGGLVILLLGGLAAGLGGGAVLGAAVLTALSPAMVFYSRCYIQETLLVFFTVGLLVAAWRFACRPGLGWALVAGVAAGLMHATKETGVLALAAMAVAFLVLGGLKRRRIGRPAAILAGGGVAVVTAAAFLSGFGTNPAGPLDSLRAYAAVVARGDETHHHPWYFYFQLLGFSRYGQGPIWSEGVVVLLAAAGGVVAWRRRGLARFLAVYTLVLAAIYAAIPHKTPWSLLSFLQGLILLAGLGAAALVRGLPRRWPRIAGALLLAAGAAHLGWQAWRGAFRFAADPRNPYVYAQTVPDTVRLGRRVEALAAVHPDGRNMRVNVIAPGGDYWPLPWYLRRLNADRIGYWSRVPAAPDAPVVVASPAVSGELEAALEGPYHLSYYGLRPTVLLALRVRKSLWQAFIARQERQAGREARAPAPPPRVTPVVAASETVPCVSHRAMGTGFQVFIAGEPEPYARQAAAAAFDLLDRLEAALSHFDPASDVSRINRLTAPEAVRVAPAVLACLRQSARFHRETGGVFDVTVGPLMKCWRTADGRSRTPTAAELDAARSVTGMALLELDEKKLTVRPRVAGVKIDLGGIGKGFAVDRMAARLRDWGIESALIHGGHSSVAALGSAPGRKGWPVALPDPQDPARTLTTLHLEDRALGASGRRQGRHIMDPRTGRPAAGHVAAWVLARTATAADALSTAFMILSLADIERYCRTHPGVAALIATRTAGTRRFGAWPEATK